MVGKNGRPGVVLVPGGVDPNELFAAAKGETSHGSIGKFGGTDDEQDGDADEVGLVLVLGVTGKLDIGKSGLIFNVFASAFSCRRHFARRF